MCRTRHKCASSSWRSSHASASRHRNLDFTNPPVTVLGRVRFKGGLIPSNVRIFNPRGGILVLDGDEFELTGLRPGRVAFLVKASKAVSKKLTRIDLAPGAVIDLGTIDLEPATDLRVIPLNERGVKVGDALLELVGLDDDPELEVSARRTRIQKYPAAARYRLSQAPRGHST